MPLYHNVSATIHVDGKALDEYQIEYDNSDKVVSCWIPSHLGKEFSIRVRNMTLTRQMKFRVKMDGDRTNSRRLAPQATQIVDKCRPSPTTYRSFVFSQRQTIADDDSVSINPSHVAGIGAIEIKVLRGKLGSKTTELCTFRNINIPETRKIPERTKKGVETCIALGQVMTRIPRIKIKRPEFKSTGCQVNFIFRYRPLDFLQAQGITSSLLTTSSNDGHRANNARKRKRSFDEVKPKVGSSKVLHTDSQTGARRDFLGVEINTEEGFAILQALRSKIDQVLAEKDLEIRPRKKHKAAVNAKGKIIDLT